MRNARGRTRWVAAGMLLAAMAGPAAADDGSTRGGWDTGRLSLDFMAGQSWLLDDKVAPGITLKGPGGPNPLLGGSIGYAISEHWGIELQAQFTEMDVRSDAGDKLAEYANLTLMPVARFRWPVGDGRWVPWATGGIGASFNEPNDRTSATTSIRTEGTTIAGTLAVGIDYFLTDDVVLGVGLHSFIYPDQDTEVTSRDSQGRVTHTNGTLNYTSLALLGHVRMLLGEAAGDGRPRRLFFADRGPFDTGERRFYGVGLFGAQRLVDDGFGGDVSVKTASSTATVGGALGMNFDAHWGAEVQMLVVDRILEATGRGKLGELSTWTVVPTLRFRYPFLDGRLVPFWTAGVGLGFVRPNDHQPYFVSDPTLRTPSVFAGGPGVVGTVGVGIEYFLNRHLSAGLAIPVQFGPGVGTTVTYPGGAPVHGHFTGTSVGATFRLTAYVP